MVVGIQNPIHAILILISVFLLGSTLLFIVQMEYFALLFIIVYVGAIVVLFLFIVMMLEIKMVNVSIILSDFFSYRTLILGVLLVQFTVFLFENVISIGVLYDVVITHKEPLIYFKENNVYIDYSHVLQRLDQLRTLGAVLFTEYKLTIFVAGFLLFLSMVGSIVLTLEISSRKALKAQDPNIQALRHPVLTQNSFRAL